MGESSYLTYYPERVCTFLVQVILLFCLVNTYWQSEYNIPAAKIFGVQLWPSMNMSFAYADSPIAPFYQFLIYVQFVAATGNFINDTWYKPIVALPGDEDSIYYKVQAGFDVAALFTAICFISTLTDETWGTSGSGPIGYVIVFMRFLVASQLLVSYLAQGVKQSPQLFNYYLFLWEYISYGCDIIYSRINVYILTPIAAFFEFIFVYLVNGCHLICHGEEGPLRTSYSSIPSTHNEI